MIGRIGKNPQLNLYQVPLVQLINLKHKLCNISNKINWESIEKEFSDLYKNTGRPSVPIRKIVGLILLKYAYHESDESAIGRWIENPYWQYFCGEVNFQKKQPFSIGEFYRFRKRIGETGKEKLLKLAIELFGKQVSRKKMPIADSEQKNIFQKIVNLY